MKRILLDCDGVLADFLTPCLEITNRIMMHLSQDEYGAPFEDRSAFGDPHPERWTRPRTLEEMDSWNILDSLKVAKGVKRLVYDEMKAPGWCEKKIPPFASAQTAVEQLKKLGWEVVVVTSPMDGPTWTYERERWLKKHFDIDRRDVIHADKKYVVEGNVLVDDKPEHIFKWCEHQSGFGVLWDYYTNQHVKEVNWRGTKTNNWNHLLELIRVF